jgi:hypothetical protein
MCLNETYSKVHTGKRLSDSFPIQNGLKQGNALLPLPFNFAERLKYQEGAFCAKSTHLTISPTKSFPK